MRKKWIISLIVLFILIALGYASGTKFKWNLQYSSGAQGYFIYCSNYGLNVEKLNFQVVLYSTCPPNPLRFE